MLLEQGVTMELFSREKTFEVLPNKTLKLEEFVVREVPCKIFLNDECIGSSMVLPCDLKEFGVGFLFSQGYIKGSEDIKSVEVRDINKVFVYTKDRNKEKRDTIFIPGCEWNEKTLGIMIEKSLEKLKEYKVKLSEVDRLIEETLKRNEIGNLTHCIHACSFWSRRGFEAFYADVGRHNAIDKMIGAMLLGKFSSSGAIYTTGRLTSDMVLKCARVGIPILISRGATSSLGLEIARRTGITLICYARPGRVNVFNRPDRVIRGN